jgi:stage IV sporulation protein FB
VLLMEPNETAWDLRWRMFGIPVRVHPMFWLLSAILGGNCLRLGIHYLLIWIGCVFVSVLIHELGHVAVGMVFGTRGRIVLYGFGGLAVGSNQLDHRWQRIAVSFAGPLAGFAFLAVVLAALWARDPEVFRAHMAWALVTLRLPLQIDEELGVLMTGLYLQHRLEYFLVSSLIFVNLVWGLLNLLPVWPLDGGQISRDVCQGVSPSGGLKFSLGISMVTAGLLCLHCILAASGQEFLPLPFGSVYSAIFFGLFAIQSFQALQQVHAEEQWTERHWDRED